MKMRGGITKAKKRRRARHLNRFDLRGIKGQPYASYGSWRCFVEAIAGLKIGTYSANSAVRQRIKKTSVAAKLRNEVHFISWKHCIYSIDIYTSTL